MIKNTLQMKNQGEKLQDQINEEGIGNLSEKEIRVMIIKMFKNIENRIEKMLEIFNTFNKDIKEIKKKQMVMNNTITEIKNTLEGIDSRITEAEE